MINFITRTDMTGRYSIALVGDNDVTKFNNFVTDEQYNSLIDLLGTELYNEFNAGLDEDPILDKWVNLRDGATYTDCNSCVQNWQGLKNMLIPLIYSLWIENIRFTLGRNGLINFNKENAASVGEYSTKKVGYRAWNEYYKKYNLAYNYLDANLSDYDTLQNKIINRKSIITKGSIK